MSINLTADIIYIIEKLKTVHNYPLVEENLDLIRNIIFIYILYRK